MFFSYTIRNLIARRRVVLPTVAAIAATVAATTIMLAILEGLLGAIRESGHPNNAIVIKKGAQSEASSLINNTVFGKIKVASGVAMENGVEQVSPEYVIPLKFRQSNGQIRTVTVRGVDPIALALHRAKITRGAMFQHSVPGILIGAKQLGQAEGFVEGGEIRIGRHRWPVVGVMEAAGTIFESELWCDRSSLMGEMRRDNFSAVYAALTSKEILPKFVADIERIAEQQVESLSEEAYFKRAFDSVELYINAITVVSFILGLGAIFASANAMYAAFLGRMRELATLNAIGYTRRRVALLLLQESFVLALVSGIIGILLSFLVHGRTLNYREMSVVYTIRISPRVLLAGLSIAGVIGIFGGIVSVVQAMKLKILSALRSM